MKESEKFIVRICCEPQIKIVDDDEITSFTQKITTMRAEKIDEGIIGQLRELMRVKGINELYTIDESKVLEMVKKSQAFDIVKEKRVNIAYFYQFVSEYRDTSYEQYLELRKINGVVYAITQNEILTEEEYNFLKEMILCH